MTKIIQELLVLNPEAALFDERLTSALIGIGTRYFLPPVAIYSKKQIQAILLGSGMTQTELLDYYNWHIVQLNAGEHSPVIFDDTAFEGN